MYSFYYIFTQHEHVKIFHWHKPITFIVHNKMENSGGSKKSVSKCRVLKRISAFSKLRHYVPLSLKLVYILYYLCLVIFKGYTPENIYGYLNHYKVFINSLTKIVNFDYRIIELINFFTEFTQFICRKYRIIYES